ncbi:putative armadillo-like helical protein [Helianthus debilis subsp. tardiflorus]
MEASTSTSSSAIRPWRTAFLSLRDEVQNSPTNTTLIHLLNTLIFSKSQTLIPAIANLPVHEVTSDAMFLVELARNLLGSRGNDDALHALVQLSQLIHYFSDRISFKMTSVTWVLVLHTFGGMVEMFLGADGVKRDNVAEFEATKQCLDTVRSLVDYNQRTIMLSDNAQLLEFLLKTVSYSQNVISPCFSGNIQGYSLESRKIGLQRSNLLEIQTTAFTMISDVFSRSGTSLQAHHWKSTVDAFRNVMDALASKSLLVENNVMDRFYTSILHCLHVVLINAKGPIQDHVAGFVAALRMFFGYGLTNNSNKSQIVYKKESRTTHVNSHSAESNSGAYVPPHVRKKNQLKDSNSLSTSDGPRGTLDYMSSDSDLSDSDGSAKGIGNFRSSKVRVAAIVCIQDLCRSDPKSFAAQWTILLPSSDVLQARRYEANLMTCLLFDPYLKARIASASTLTTMLEGPASVFLQVAEYKESTKLGSFTALSSSLGQILMQLHTGILHLIKQEKNNGLLTSLFKILTLLISCTPYSRMPDELLPTVILSLHQRIIEGFLTHSDQSGLLAVALSCLTDALSVSPSSLKVNEMFVAEISKGLNDDKASSGLLSTLLHYSRSFTNPTVSLEALQVLKAVAHNYPNIMVLCWKQFSSIICDFLDPPGSSRAGTVNSRHTVGTIGEKVLTNAIKLLDECLRAISGFKGTEDLADDKLPISPFTYDYVKVKTISSAPSYVLDGQMVASDDNSVSGSQQWCEAIEKPLSLTLFHSSSMVRAASVTCFAGITSGVFFSLPEDKQDQIISYSINAAFNDEVPSVRSAACRAIGVIACFPQALKSVEILGKFINAAEINSRHSLVPVRIAAAWALANLCDSLRHCIDRFTLERSAVDLIECSKMVSLLIDCSLRLTRDGDKIKANAVRALGNLSRFVPCSSQDVNGISATSLLQLTWEDSSWLERMVQAFLSCVTTGNVKVRWNVCHALSNLFLNETLKLQDTDWASSVFSILLLLLRDSSNFKIRIQAAAALATPPTIFDYGKSYSDVVQGVLHTLENLGSDQMFAPSSFKYRVALEKQLTSTMLHVLGLASESLDHPVHDFLVKKASFLEDWLKALCLSLVNQIEAEHDSTLNQKHETNQSEAEHDSTLNQKKEVINRAIKSLVKVYEGRNNQAMARRFDKLANAIL